MSAPRSIPEMYGWGRSIHGTLNACGVLIGGSSVYRPCDQDAAADFDAVIIMPRMTDVVELLVNREKQDTLIALLEIERVEVEGIDILISDPRAAGKFDTVRFAGYTAVGRKKSVKITSAEHYQNENIHSDNIASFKDRRVYEASGPGNVEHYRLQQVSVAITKCSQTRRSRT